MKYAVGIYNSTIISTDIGDNVVIDNVNYLSHYILGNEVILVNVNELATTDHSKFGIGILKEGEPEDIRIWMEICNENGGRKVIPFSGMLPGDAFLWSKYEMMKYCCNTLQNLLKKSLKMNVVFTVKLAIEVSLKIRPLLKMLGWKRCLHKRREQT